MTNKLQRHVTHCIWLLNIICQYILYGIIISNKLKLDLKKKVHTCMRGETSSFYGSST